MAEKWRKGDNLGSFLKREKVKGTIEQLKHERQAGKVLKEKNKRGR